MRDRIAILVGALRARGVPVSVAEAIDAASAAAAVGVERRALADALAAALVKDEGDRGAFDACFAEVFPARAPASVAARRRRQGAAPAGGAGAGGAVRDDSGAGGSPPGSVETSASPPQRTDTAPSRDDAPRAGGPRSDADAEARPRARIGTGSQDAESHARAPGDGDEEAGTARAALAPSNAADRAGPGSAAAARARALGALPFAAMSPLDVEEAAALVRTLARRVSTRLRRRLRPRRRGRLDFRRTLRAATPYGGVPLVRHYRGRRPRPPALVALCDLSVSAATATDFFLALLAPAAAHFARVRLFGFVDRLVEIEFVAGRVRPAGPIDLMARSDFGRVLRDLTAEAAGDLTRDTVLLVLGDARNNRRPPGADLLRAARERVRRVVWLNPEPVARWNTGDSVIASYARHVDALVACGSLGELAEAVAAVGRG